MYTYMFKHVWVQQKPFHARDIHSVAVLLLTARMLHITLSLIMSIIA